ncbi:hypothetical protein [Egibacter rhizosphaerae]|uniref:hypothetical protein n=1 Tax=Egibacter rhizosphaerae TaxID=1670831 RepID=UPI0013F172DA|nr:hypothetical protein [Egibacter rhizosphaerae]
MSVDDPWLPTEQGHTNRGRTILLRVLRVVAWTVALIVLLALIAVLWGEGFQ